MSLRSVLVLVLVVGVALGLPVFGFAIEGEYGSTYQGITKVRITKTGDVYHVRWDLNDGTYWVGVGLLNKAGDTFTVASVTSRGKEDEYANGSLHISVFKVEKQGASITQLVSDCAQYGDMKVHQETLTPKKN